MSGTQEKRCQSVGSRKKCSGPSEGAVAGRPLALFAGTKVRLAGPGPWFIVDGLPCPDSAWEMDGLMDGTWDMQGGTDMRIIRRGICMTVGRVKYHSGRTCSTMRSEKL